MNHLRIAHLIIVVVLACPYFCMGHVAGSTSAICESGCGCSHGQSQDSPGEPADPAPDCLCQGAVVDGEVRSTDIELSVPHSVNGLACDIALVGRTCSVSSRIAFESPHSFPPFSTGRDVCALTCTFLI